MKEQLNKKKMLKKITYLHKQEQEHEQIDVTLHISVHIDFTHYFK